MRIARIASLILLMSLLGAAALARFAGPTVSTDKADYRPGSTVQISGSGFAANDTITLQVVHTDGTNDAGDADHQPWTVSADGQGSFTGTWYVDPADSIGSSFLLTANGT